MYLDLVGEQCIWDFVDLFLSSMSLFGDSDAYLLFFDTKRTTDVAESIVRDWSHPSYDQSSTMGLLSLFAAWILYDPIICAQNTVLYDHAQRLAHSVERHDPELMMSRPFVLWLLAKTVLEIPGPPQRRPDGVILQNFRGLLLGSGLSLPIYVPDPNGRKPEWDFFRGRSAPEQRRVIELVAGAAHHMGDYNLQQEALKLLILQSVDPRGLMDTLASLQLDVQADKMGYAATVLSKFLAINGPTEEAELLQRLEEPGEGAGTFDFEQNHNASLVWAWSMIRTMLTCSVLGVDTGASGDGRGTRSFKSYYLEKGIKLEEWKLPPRIVDFSLGIGLTTSSSSPWPQAGAPRSKLYGRHTAQQLEKLDKPSHRVPSDGPQVDQMAGSTRMQEMGRPSPLPLPPPSYPKHSPSSSHQHQRTAPATHHTRHASQLGGYNTTGRSSLQTPHRQRSRERVRGWLEWLGSNEDKHQAAPDEKQENNRGHDHQPPDRDKPEPPPSQRQKKHEDRQTPRDKTNGKYDADDGKAQSGTSDSPPNDRVQMVVEDSHEMGRVTFPKRLLADGGISIVYHDKDEAGKPKAYLLKQEGLYEGEPPPSFFAWQQSLVHKHTTAEGTGEEAGFSVQPTTSHQSGLVGNEEANDSRRSAAGPSAEKGGKTRQDLPAPSAADITTASSSSTKPASSHDNMPPAQDDQDSASAPPRKDEPSGAPLITKKDGNASSSASLASWPERDRPAPRKTKVNKRPPWQLRRQSTAEDGSDSGK